MHDFEGKRYIFSLIKSNRNKIIGINDMGPNNVIISDVDMEKEIVLVEFEDLITKKSIKLNHVKNDIAIID